MLVFSLTGTVHCEELSLCLTWSVRPQTSCMSSRAGAPVVTRMPAHIYTEAVAELHVCATSKAKLYNAFHYFSSLLAISQSL